MDSSPDNATGPKTRHIAANPAFSPCFDFDRLLVGLIANPKRTLLDIIKCCPHKCHFSAGALPSSPQRVIASRFQMETTRVLLRPPFVGDLGIDFGQL